MKIGIMSDLHMGVTVRTRETTWDFEPEDGVFYICAGDVCEDANARHRWIQKHQEYLFAINGNHDYYHDTFAGSECHVSSIVKDGIKIAGATLWTDLSNPLDWITYTRNLIDTRYISDLTQERYMETHKQHKRFLFESEADIIVSHHCPSLLSVHERYRGSPANVCFTTDLFNDILSMKSPPKLWIHGHTHEEFDYMIGNTRVICHPRGYKNERDEYYSYNPKIVEI